MEVRSDNLLRGVMLVVLLMSAYGGRQLLETPSIFWDEGVQYSPLNVTEGSTVTFNWDGVHDVWNVPSATCPTDFSAGPGVQELAPAALGGTYTTPALAPGTYYYACSVGDHCTTGQLITVNVA